MLRASKKNGDLVPSSASNRTSITPSNRLSSHDGVDTGPPSAFIATVDRISYPFQLWWRQIVLSTSRFVRVLPYLIKNFLVECGELVFSLIGSGGPILYLLLVAYITTIPCNGLDRTLKWFLDEVLLLLPKVFNYVVLFVQNILLEPINVVIGIIRDTFNFSWPGFNFSFPTGGSSSAGGLVPNPGFSGGFLSSFGFFDSVSSGISSGISDITGGAVGGGEAAIHFAFSIPTFGFNFGSFLDVFKDLRLITYDIIVLIRWIAETFAKWLLLFLDGVDCSYWESITAHAKYFAVHLTNDPVYHFINHDQQLVKWTVYAIIGLVVIFIIYITFYVRQRYVVSNDIIENHLLTTLLVLSPNLAALEKKQDIRKYTSVLRDRKFIPDIDRLTYWQTVLIACILATCALFVLIGLHLGQLVQGEFTRFLSYFLISNTRSLETPEDYLCFGICIGNIFYFIAIVYTLLLVISKFPRAIGDLVLMILYLLDIGYTVFVWPFAVILWSFVITPIGAFLFLYILLPASHCFGLFQHIEERQAEAARSAAKKPHLTPIAKPSNIMV